MSLLAPSAPQKPPVLFCGPHRTPPSVKIDSSRWRSSRSTTPEHCPPCRGSRAVTRPRDSSRPPRSRALRSHRCRTCCCPTGRLRGRLGHRFPSRFPAHADPHSHGTERATTTVAWLLIYSPPTLLHLRLERQERSAGPWFVALFLLRPFLQSTVQHLPESAGRLREPVSQQALIDAAQVVIPRSR